MRKFLAGLAAGAVAVCAGYALASRNSSGTYTLATSAVTSNQVIGSTLWNSTFNDLASEVTNSLSRDGQGGMRAALRGVDGTVAAPALSFTSETGSGLYRIGTSDVGFAISGGKKLELTGALFTVTPASSFLTRPTVTITSASGAAVNAAASMVIDSSAAHFLQLTGPNATHEGILFGDVAAGSRGYIQYNNSGDTPADTMAFGVASSTRASISASGLIIGASGTAIGASYGGSAVIGSNSVSANTCRSADTITVTGAASGDTCSLGGPQSSSLSQTCYISAGNTATIIFCNPTVGAVNTVAGTYAARVFH